MQCTSRGAQGANLIDPDLPVELIVGHRSKANHENRFHRSPEYVLPSFHNNMQSYSGKELTVSDEVFCENLTAHNGSR